MQSTSEGCLNIAELANQLRREKVFINSEKQILQTLNEQVHKASLELLQSAWICTHQRQNLTDLITSRCEADSVLATQRASALGGTTFIEAHKVFKYKEANALGELLGWLRDSPHLVALCLLLGEDHIPPSLPASLLAGLYGSCRSPADRTGFLALMRSLIKHQLVPAPDPRKLFRTGKSALGLLYAVFRDNQTEVRQFLVAALGGPVSTVMQEDEFFLDIDPDKALERFSPTDRFKKFGQVNSADYTSKVGRYRKWTVQSLYNLTSQFVTSLRDHWVGFPNHIAWIVQQIVHLLNKHARTNERELHALCTDIVLNHMICPAIVSPESHGVVELPVSYVARSNLIQIAQILQVLALINHEPVENRARDLYSKFERTCVSSLIERVCSMPALASGGVGGGGGAELAALRAERAAAAPVALYTRQALGDTINFLQRTSSKLNNNTPSVTSEEASSSSGAVAEAAGYSENLSDGSSTGSETCTSNLAALLQSIEPNYRSRLHDLLRKLPDLSSPPPEKQDTPTENGPTKRGILAKVPKPRLPRSSGSQEDKSANGDAKEEKMESPEVLMIRLASLEEQDYIGLISESKILECYYGGSEAGDADEAGSALAVAGNTAPLQKRTRFSVSHDEVSLGNTSDNLEAVSEAASNHSVTSSLELETEDQNDNLSDMVSANVSGRGSPNISGRETPSSQVTDGDAPTDNIRRLPPLPVNQNAAARAQKLLKQTRNDIEDKFCKFEIKKLLEGDETVSVMSDTWSTDVLASDSETVGEQETHTALNHGTNTSSTIAPDVSETASESAWSMDVLASDSDRNTEVDTDDCVSVAARSDTSGSRRMSQPDDTPQHMIKRMDQNSPRHGPRSNMTNRSTSYLSATAQLSRGGELDLSASSPAASPARAYNIENRKSILVNGYPVMTCYAASSAPESPSMSAGAGHSHGFDYGPSTSYSERSESTLEGHGGDATSQWVDESWTRATHYQRPDLHYGDDIFARRGFDSGVECEGAEGGAEVAGAGGAAGAGGLSELVTRMATVSVAASSSAGELRTSVVSISSSRIERKSSSQPQPSTSGVMSQSTLSLKSETSVSDRSSSQDVNSEVVTERRVSPPPSIKLSTGAIPKSISFDATPESHHRRRLMGDDGIVSNLDELKNNVKRSGSTLLHKIKIFRHRSRQHTNGSEPAVEAPRTTEESTASAGVGAGVGEARGAEDILAKYRRRSSGDARPPRPARTHNNPPPDSTVPEGVVDLNDPEVFNNMKRKLRIVLSDPDLHGFDYVPTRSNNSLTEWITAASCRTSSVSSSAAAAACARPLAAADSARLAASLRADLAARRPYAAYLANCRAALTHHANVLQRQIAEVRVAGAGAARAAAAARALQQLERGAGLRRVRAAHYTLADGELMDERASRLTANIRAITAEVRADPAWDGAAPGLLEMAEITVERAVFARLYLHVLFPNGDGDIARDQVLSAHIRRLGGVRAAALGVAARHVWAAPWAAACDLLRRLPLARTPRDKLACIMKCIAAIMSVLGLETGTPAADDLTPVLVYVIIRVNPPSLLSTIELVNALGGAALSGEALYWWTHFCAAVAHIKTVD